MKRYKFLILIVVFCTSSVFSQDIFKFREYLKFRPNMIFFDTTIVVQKTLKAGEKILVPSSIYLNNQQKVIKTEQTLKEDLNFSYNKTVTDTLNSLRNLCDYSSFMRIGCKVKINISESEKTPNRLYINFFNTTLSQSKGSYYLELNNRKAIEFTYFTSFVSGQIIPFKYRPEISKDSLKVRGRMQTQFNASLSLGVNWGRAQYYYRKYEGTKSYKKGGSFLFFAGPSLITIDKANSHLSRKPILDHTSVNTGALSVGIGTTLNVRNFSAGFFIGKDFAFGESKKQWNYHNKFWTGFGFGYATSLNAIASALSFSPN